MLFYRVLWTYEANYADEPIQVSVTPHIHMMERDTVTQIREGLKKRLGLYSDVFWAKANFHCFGSDGSYIVF